jgi:predicted ATPase/serine phosphatase RsbU (regulator of sigma subunit)/tRNA A-37 threonylcarbamoyl transferase component Bud32
MQLINIPGYTIKDQIYQGEHNAIYRAVREIDHSPVVLKLLRDDYPAPQEIVKLRREYEIMRDLDLPGIVRVADLVSYRNQPALVLEDFGGQALSQLIAAGPIELAGFFYLAVQLVVTLAELHRRGLIHKDLKPANIIVNPLTMMVKITDFGISTRFSQTKPQTSNLRRLEGTLAYMSPEQTGRMNRSIDYRTDFYSLGVTFYEMLSGRLPFDSSDPLELVHAHIARRPPPLHRQNPGVPEMLSAIVERLMAKTAEERYQSAVGLLADLERCRREWQDGGQVRPFELRSADRSERLTIPQVMYGREREIALLHASFERVTGGWTEMLLVSGQAGIGKSALINELQRAISSRRGFYGSGKFDHLQRNAPYAAIIAALREVARQILAEDESTLAWWRSTILTALGPNGQLVIDVIPEVAWIIGRQRPVAEAGPPEARNRFQLVFQRLMRCLSRPEQPLVLFFDDLHQADAASLSLLAGLLSDKQSRGLLLLGAYRDHELSAAHPLRRLLDELETSGTAVQWLRLEPLGEQHIRQLVADTLQSDSAAVARLARLIWKKTSGSPFFVHQFLHAINAEGHLRFNPQLRCWVWDLDAIRAMSSTDNVIDLMVNTIQRLPPATQQYLTLAACFGSSFDLVDVATIADRHPAPALRELWPAIDAGLILPIDLEYTLYLPEVGLSLAGSDVPRSYRFLHDRVQQAAYVLLSDEQRQATHLRIGRMLRNRMAQGGAEDALFDLVNQLNLGRALIDCTAERSELLRLNLRAARQAMAAAAYLPAAAHADTALQLVTVEHWRSDYQLALDVHILAAELAALNAEFATMEQIIDLLIRHAASRLDQVRGHEIRIQSLIARNRSYEALQWARVVLHRLGLHLPQRPGPLRRSAVVLRSYLRLRWHLLRRRQGIRDLANLPAMTDASKLALARLLASVTAAAYNTAPALHILVASRQIELFLAYGNPPEAAYSYTAYGLLLGSSVGDVTASSAFGALALDMLQQQQTNHLAARIVLNVYGFILHRRQAMAKSLEPLRNGFQTGLNSGDFEFAAICAYAYGYHRFWLGHDLVSMAREMQDYSNQVQALKRARPARLIELLRHVMLCLLGETDGPTSLSNEVFDEAQVLDQLQAAHDYTTLCVYHIYKLWLSFLADDLELAEQHSRQAGRHLSAVSQSIFVPVFDLLCILVMVARPVVPRWLQRQAQRSLVRLGQWARQAPMNYQQKYMLAQAELSRRAGKAGAAREYYDRAIRRARENGFVNDEALACELAGRFHLEHNRPDHAQLYLRDARYAYVRWGARSKVAALDRAYPGLLTSGQAGTATGGALRSLATLSTIVEPASASALDLASVIKASQAISEKLVLDDLLTRLIAIMAENAGAQYGHLILQRDEQLSIEASSVADGSHHASRGSVPLDGAETPVLARSVVNVVARTREPVLLADASEAEQFVRDPYIVAMQPRSILCLPLLHHAQLIGLIYLENNLTRDAFTVAHLEVLNLLAAQAAISIENAGLYSGLEDLVAERTMRLTEANRQLQALTDQMQAELNLAHHIQQNLLQAPRPDWPGVDLICYTAPAREVGGDFYSYAVFSDQHRILAIGDISGKGLPAALLMAVSLATLQSIKIEERSPAQVLALLDGLLLPYTRSTRQNCALCFVELRARRLCVSNAGCIAPLIRRVDDRLEWLEHGDLPLGIDLPGIRPRSEVDVPLAAGDLVVLTSDGVVEARNREGDLFGFERLEQLVAVGPAHSAAALLSHMRRGLLTFAEGVEAQDDISIIILRIAD